MAHAIQTKSIPRSVSDCEHNSGKMRFEEKNKKIRQQTLSLMIEDASQYGRAKVEPMGRCFSEQEPSSPMRIPLPSAKKELGSRKMKLFE